VWDVDHGELIQTLEGHTEGVSDIAWSHDGDYLASASDDKTIRVWSVEEVEFLRVLLSGILICRLAQCGESTEGTHKLCLLRKLQPFV
jgi:WD40 repeat protein